MLNLRSNTGIRKRVLIPSECANTPGITGTSAFKFWFAHHTVCLPTSVRLQGIACIVCDI
jgi:hypothetical protein